MEDNKLYAIRVKVFDGDCGLDIAWLNSDYDLYGREEFNFTKLDVSAKMYMNESRVVKIAKEVRDRFPNIHSVEAVEIKAIYKLEVKDIINMD